MTTDIDASNVTVASIAALAATNRDVLVEYIKGVCDIEAVDEVLRVSIQGEGMCGSWASYKTLDDIPAVSVPCSCGDPTHWFIKYEE